MISLVNSIEYSFKYHTHPFVKMFKVMHIVSSTLLPKSTKIGIKMQKEKEINKKELEKSNPSISTRCLHFMIQIHLIFNNPIYNS